MYKFVVVTHPDMASGYRLAGVDVFEADSPGKAGEVIASLEEKEEVGIIAVSEELLYGMDEKSRKKVEDAIMPIIIAIPSRLKGMDRKAYIERLLRNAIGYNIVVRR